MSANKSFEPNNGPQERVRMLPLEGLYNVRDLGGYPANNGQVAWNLLYRSGDLTNLKKSARKYLENRNIKTIVDLRDEFERKMAPDGELKTVKNSYWIPISAGSVVDLRKAVRDGMAEGAMEELYRFMILQAIPQFQEIFRILQQERNAPLLFHCSAGKDRAGVTAALVLSALGTDRETIIQDYMLSEIGLGDKYQDLVEENPRMGPVLSVNSSYIAAAFSAMDEKYGSPEAYLREALGADLEKLQQLYCEPLENQP